MGTSPILLEQDFLKHGGGLLKNQRQKRHLKLHETNEISYWKQGQLRGVIPITTSSICETIGKTENSFMVTFMDLKTSENRKLIFE